MAENINQKIIGLVVALILVSYLGPVGIDAFFNASTTTWNAQTVALWGIVIVMFAVALFLLFIKYVEKGR